MFFPDYVASASPQSPFRSIPQTRKLAVSRPLTGSSSSRLLCTDLAPVIGVELAVCVVAASRGAPDSRRRAGPRVGSPLIRGTRSLRRVPLRAHDGRSSTSSRPSRSNAIPRCDSSPEGPGGSNSSTGRGVPPLAAIDLIGALSHSGGFVRSFGTIASGHIRSEYSPCGKGVVLSETTTARGFGGSRFA